LTTFKISQFFQIKKPQTPLAELLQAEHGKPEHYKQQLSTTLRRVL
jgi:hypothetical protein